METHLGHPSLKFWPLSISHLLLFTFWDQSPQVLQFLFFPFRIFRCHLLGKGVMHIVLWLQLGCIITCPWCEILRTPQPVLGLSLWGRSFPYCRCSVCSFALLKHLCQGPPGTPPAFCISGTTEKESRGFVQLHCVSACDGSIYQLRGTAASSHWPGCPALSPLAVSKHCTTWAWRQHSLCSATADHALVSSLGALTCLLTLATTHAIFYFGAQPDPPANDQT